MTYFEYIMPPLLLIFGVYLLAAIWRMFRAPARDMINVGKENTQAVQENSALLKELIEINKNILEQHHRTKS